MIVVDASVAAKWLLDEPDASQALELLHQNSGRLVAPSLIRIEVANALVRPLRVGVLTATRVQVLCSAWDQMLEDGVLALTPSDQLFDHAVQLAVQIRHPVPDCLYLALAVELDASLVTADGPMYERGLSIHQSIVLFGKAA